MPKEPKDLERHVCFNVRGNDGRVMAVWRFAKGAEAQTVIARGWLTTRNAHRALVRQLVLRGHVVGRFLDWAVGRHARRCRRGIAARPDGLGSHR